MEEENSDVAEEVTAEEDNLAIDDEWEARAGEPNRGPETENGEDLEGLREFEPEEGHEDEDGVVEELERRESPAPENREERPESVEETGERSHWNGVVFERRQNQRVSRISAAVDRRIPAKIVNEINAMAREWSAGIGPSGNGRRYSPMIGYGSIGTLRSTAAPTGNRLASETSSSSSSAMFSSLTGREHHQRNQTINPTPPSPILLF
nr:unnamed protein product [Ipomoea batatas]